VVPASPREVRVTASRVASSEAGCTALIYSAPVGSVGDEEDKSGCWEHRRVTVALSQRTIGHGGSSRLQKL
jgi:hypothetical protein